MPNELRSGPGPKYGLLDGFSDMFRNKLQGPSYFDDATAIVNRLMSRPSTSQRLASWEYERTPPMPNEGQQNILGRLLGAVPDNVMLASNFIGPGAKPLPAKPSGIRAYHGSPHDFDKFSLDHIGKGEGAQAYGHGLYFAENEGVAKSYRDALRQGVDYQGNGYPGGSSSPAAKQVADRIFDQHTDPAEAIKRTIAEFTQAAESAAAAGNVGGAAGRMNMERAAQYKALAEQAAQLNPADFSFKPGHMYEVNINANPDHFLDWDRPLGQQSETIQKLYNDQVASKLRTRQIGTNPNLGPLTDVMHPDGGSIGVFTTDKLSDVLSSPSKYAPTTGKDFLETIARQSVNGDWGKPGDFAMQQATNALREQGIPGIKYLDQGSRFNGDGTRNYVVFDDMIIDILRKYGLAPPAIAAGASIMGPDQQ